MENKKQVVDDIFKYQLTDLGVVDKSKEIKIGLPGGMIYQLWYLFNGLNAIYVEYQE